MACNIYRSTILEAVTDYDSRFRLTQAISHVETCDECQAAFRDFDRIAANLREEHPSAEPLRGWEAFNERLISKFANSRPTVSRRPWKTLWISTAAVSVVVIAAFFVGQKLASHSTAQRAVSKEISARQDGIDPVQVAHYTTAFQKVSEVFDRRAQWIMVANSANTCISSNMGLAPQSLNGLPNVVVLRLNMFRDKSPDAISSVDLVIVPGEAADLTVLLEPGQSVHYRIGTSAGDEAHLNLLAEIKTPKGDLPLASLSTILEMKHGQQISVGELQTFAGRYELRSAFSRAVLPVYQ